ncbi:MAG: hypothetical protein WCI53_10415 [Bacteroidota bacterium]
MSVTNKPNTYSTKINGLKISLLLFLVWFGFKGFCQNVVVSEYYNEADTRDEWTELLVINDNTDLRNYTLRDNNTSQDNWQTEIIFSNVSLWNNLRAGTIIIIWHRIRSSTVATNRVVDTLKTDGYIEVHAQLTGYFIGGDFANAPNWGGTSLSIGGNADLLQIRNASGTHIHALGHKSTITNSGNSYSAISSSNKLNHSSAIVSGINVSICPGGSINDYIGGTSDTLKTSEGASYITQGLPNKRASDTTSNLAYWRSLRQPPFTGITLNTPIDSFAFGKVRLTWTTAGWTDPDSTDGTVGYIILRNTTNSFVPPTDGKTYSTLDTVGTASVSGHVNLSSTLVYSDNYTFNCGTTYYYKIYAFRYTTNGALGTARGRAYNETGSNFSVITKPYPTAQSINPN